MLKIRVIPTLLYQDFGLVKGVALRLAGATSAAPMQAIKVYNLRDVDELVFLDVTATPDGRAPDFELIDDLADDCFMPLTVGGGVRTVDDVRRLLQVGADKVVDQHRRRRDARRSSDEAAARFGSQCVVVSIDTRRGRRRHARGVDRARGTEPTGRDPVELAREVEALGAGEILLTVDRPRRHDGRATTSTPSRAVSEAVSIPVIASGGAGSYEHMADAVGDGRRRAVAAASMFHFTEQTPMEAKHHLRQRGFPVRL